MFHGVMVALEFLVLSVIVRIGVEQLPLPRVLLFPLQNSFFKLCLYDTAFYYFRAHMNVQAKNTAKSFIINYLAVSICTPNRAVLKPILADLDRLWEMRHWIPEPGKPIFLNVDKIQ